MSLKREIPEPTSRCRAGVSPRRAQRTPLDAAYVARVDALSQQAEERGLGMRIERIELRLLARGHQSTLTYTR
jgi:hypothetical protein